MGRTITAATKTESLKSSGAKPIALIKLQFDSGDTRVWSGRGDITFNAEVYTGIGDLGRISVIEEGSEQKAFGVVLEISGVPASHISLALNEDVQGRTAQVWLGFLDDNYTLVANPTLIFQGRMDTIGGSLGETGVVIVTAESKLIDWDRPNGLLYTDSAQRELFSGDKGLEFVNEAVEREIIWGSTVVGGQSGGAVGAIRG